MSLPPADQLFEHLCALRDAADRDSPSQQYRWNAIFQWVHRAFPGQDAQAEDARQETLIALVRNVHRMTAEAPLQAAKWVSTIYRNKTRDAFRAQKKDPLTLRVEAHDPERGSILDRIEDQSEPSISPEMLQSIATLVLEQVEQSLISRTKSASRRALWRTQAQATLLRLLFRHDARAIALALGQEETLTDDRIYKWVERGRVHVIAGLDHWLTSSEADERRDLIEALRQIMLERRADAGKPRPARRAEEDAS